MAKHRSLTKTPDDTVSMDNSIDLTRFPPILRKLGKYLLNNKEIRHSVYLSEICKDIDVNYGSIRTLIWREKQKGNDFNKFLESISDSFMETSLIDVDTALVEGAVSGSHNHINTYYKRTGKMNEGVVPSGITLAIGVNIQTVIPSDTEREMGTIDIQPNIPKDKS